MAYQEYLSKMKQIQSLILKYIEEESSSQENFQGLYQIINQAYIRQNKENLKSVLHLIVNIANNHHHTPNFFTKIQDILRIFKTEIKNYWSNLTILNIFRSNKRILLFLIEEKILLMDKQIISLFKNDKEFRRGNYFYYFYNEIKPFYKEKFDQDQIANNIKNDLNDYEMKRKIGENDDEICEIIRNDEIDKFKLIENLNPFSYVKNSIFETNSFLLEKSAKIIEYALFFEASKIFQYILRNYKMDTFDCSFLYHCYNKEFLKLFEIYYETPCDINFFIEAVKCHHNSLASDIQENYLTDEEKEDNSLNVSIQILENYNFHFLTENLIEKSFFYYLCTYDYYQFTNIFIKQIDDDINKMVSEKTALFSAIEKVNIEIIELLLTNEKLNVNAFNADKKTALFLAIENENLEIIKLLLSNNKIDINIINKGALNIYDDIASSYYTLFSIEEYEKTALFVAIEKENLEIIKLLLSYNEIDVNQINKGSIRSFPCFLYNYEKTALFRAVEKQNIEIIKLLLSKIELDINATNIITEIKNGDLLKKHEKTAFSQALGYENLEIIDLLVINDKLNINILEKFKYEKFNYYTQSWDNIQFYEKAPIHIAVEKENIKMIKSLLSNKKIDVNIPNIPDNLTGLQIAVINNNLAIVKVLLKNQKIDINVKDKNEKKLTELAQNIDIIDIIDKYIFSYEQYELERKNKISEILNNDNLI